MNRASAISVMFGGAVPLPAYYLVYRLDLSTIYADLQIRWLSVLVVARTLAVLGALYTHGVYVLTLMSTIHDMFRSSPPSRVRASPPS